MSDHFEDVVRIQCGDKELLYYAPHAEDHIQKILRSTHRLYEEDVLIDILSRKLAPGLVIDVGANIGNHTIFFGKVLERKVLAFEPYEKAFDVLQKNVALNELTDRVTVFQKAAARRAGRGAIQSPPEGNWGQAAIARTDEGPVEIVRLDDLRISGPVALIKVDVEGMELDVLEGAWQLLKRHKPVLCIEARTALDYARLKRRLRRLHYQMIRRFNHTPTLLFIYCRTRKEQMAALLEKTDALASLEELAIAQRAMSRTLSHSEAALRKAFKSALLDALEKQRAAIAKDARFAAAEAVKQLRDDLLKHERETRTRNEELLTTSTEQLKNELREQIAAAVSNVIGQMAVQLSSQNKRTTAGQDGGVRLSLPFAKVCVEIRLPPQAVSPESEFGVVPRHSIAGSAIDSPAYVPAYPASNGSCDAAGRGAAPDDSISVIMTTYNSAAYVKVSVLNVLAQSHRNLELIIVDDASSDNTFEILMELAREDARVRPIKMFNNRGTYWCKNFGITRSAGRYITFQDSDDTSDVDRLRIQLRELQSTRAVMCTCNYVRVNESGEVVLNRGLRERKALIAAMLEKDEVIRHAGYFDSVRTSADDEFNRRIGIVFGHERICHVDRPLYHATVREGSLTNDSRTKSEIAPPDGSPTDQSFLSAPRREYVRQYMGWHERLKNRREKPAIRFPLLRRPFPAPALLLAEADHRESYVTASMASIPARTAMLEQTVASILPQLDVLNVYLNGYDTTPPFLNNDRIHVVHSREYGDLRDNGKFFFLDSVLYGYHFTIDDDIVYPADYVQKMILKVEQYNRQAIVGCHGVVFANPFIRFMDGRKVFHFKRKLERDTLVNLLGTGTTAYHTSTIRLSPADFEQPGMADVWLAIAAKRQNIPMIAIQRPECWLVPLAEAEETSLYSGALRDDEIQTAVIEKEMPWQLNRLSQFPLVRSLLNRFTTDELVSQGVDVQSIDMDGNESSSESLIDSKPENFLLHY